MTQVVDRRAQPGTTTSSRERFVRRNKKHIKEAVDRAISNGNVTDIGSGGVDVTVPKRDLSEPFIHHGQGGVNDRVHPGNKEFIKGDRLPRPKGGGGGGAGKGEASDSGEGEDDFTFHLSEEEFLNYLFDDLALPNLEEKKEADLERTRLAHAGIVSSGAPNKLHLQRSKRQKMGRVIAARKPWNDKILELLAEEKEILGSYDPDATEKPDSGLPKAWSPKRDQIRGLEKEVSGLKDKFGVAVSGEHAARIADIEIEIAAAKRGISLIPGWNESTDLKFRHSLPKPIPNSKAVMFCVMDVSGSMDEETKNKAKIFYFLLYRFLKRHYQKTDVVFIRHHTQAQEVNEHDFFYERSTGGTIVSSGLTLMKNIMNQRYNDGNWNIYGAQASDGDNWDNGDNAKCRMLMDDILKDAQAYFYTEITDGAHQNLWRTYETVKSAYPEKFWMGHIVDRKDIFPVFREFFKRNGKDGQSVASQLKPQAYAIG